MFLYEIDRLKKKKKKKYLSNRLSKDSITYLKFVRIFLY